MIEYLIIGFLVLTVIVLSFLLRRSVKNGSEVIEEQEYLLQTVRDVVGSLYQYLQIIKESSVTVSYDPTVAKIYGACINTLNWFDEYFYKEKYEKVFTFEDKIKLVLKILKSNDLTEFGIDNKVEKIK